MIEVSVAKYILVRELQQLQAYIDNNSKILLYLLITLLFYKISDGLASKTEGKSLFLDLVKSFNSQL